MKKKILLLEDDALLGETLEELLEQEGYEVILVTCGNDAINESYENDFNLYVFDINVPDMSGLELLESLRGAEDKTPTIFISALVDLNSISKAFEIGADDYIKKPFFPQELLIRVDAKMQKLNSTIRCKDLNYNPVAKELYKNDKLISLSYMLSEMLHLLITSQNKVVDKIELEECMENPTSTALRVAITKLKQLTGIEIKNIRGVGYMIESC